MPITVIIPLPPVAVDASVSVVMAKVSQILGQPLIPVNKPGAGMRIGTAEILRVPKDALSAPPECRGKLEA